MPYNNGRNRAMSKKVSMWKSTLPDSKCPRPATKAYTAPHVPHPSRWYEWGVIGGKSVPAPWRQMPPPQPMIRSLLPRAICPSAPIYILGIWEVRLSVWSFLWYLSKTPDTVAKNQRNPGNGQHHAQYQGHDEFDGVDITQISSDEIIGDNGGWILPIASHSTIGQTTFDF